MTMPIRQAISPAEARKMDTTELRANFLIEELFVPGEIALTYSHLDRTIVGGATPAGSGPLTLKTSKEVGSDPFLKRREMGVVNIAGAGSITVDGEKIAMSALDCLYIPAGTKDVVFASDNPAEPAKFYIVSTPAHQTYPLKLIRESDANKLDLGSSEECNKRILRQYIHPDICQSCQLVMGITALQTGSIWNTMPAHVHDRRSEVYMYFNMAEATRVFHMMGEPDETRHLVVKNEQAILSPGWSIHSGAGTGAYTFIWSMGGDNQDFTDMDFIKMEDLR